MRRTLLPLVGLMLSFCITFAQNPTEEYFQDGLTKQNKGDLPGAMLAFTSAIQTNMDHAPSYYRRGLLKVALKDYRGAMRYYDEAIGITSKDSKAFLYCGMCRLIQEDLSGALRDFNSSIESQRGEIITSTRANLV